MRKYFVLIAAALCGLIASCGKKGGEADAPVVPGPEEMTVAQFIADTLRPADLRACLSGTVSKVEDDALACFYLADATGEVYVYGLWDGPAGSRVASLSAAGFSEGSEISIAAFRAVVNGRVEAGEAYVYSEDASRVDVSPVRMELPADACDTSVVVNFKGEYSVEASEGWIHPVTTRALPPEWKSEVVRFSVDANTELQARKGTLSVKHADGQIVRVLIVQAPGEKALLNTLQAINADYARVQGTVNAICDGGYILSDLVGSIFIKASTTGVAIGAEMDVTGPVATANYVTYIVPDVSRMTALGSASYPKVNEISKEDLESLLSSTLEKSPTAPGALKIRYVALRGGFRYSSEGSKLIVTKDKVEPRVLGSDFFDAAQLDMRRIVLYGYLLGCTDGALCIAPVSADATAKNYITIDGDFSDWDELPEGSYVEAVCAPNAKYSALQKVTFFSDEIYLYMRVLIDESQIIKSKAPFHIYMDCDGSAFGDERTGGGMTEFLDNDVDYMTEGDLYYNGGLRAYTPSTHLYSGPVGAVAWTWTSAGTSGSVCNNEGNDSECEIRLDKSKFNATTGPKFSDTFGVAINIANDKWKPIGALPNDTPTAADTLGRAHLAKVNVWVEE